MLLVADVATFSRLDGDHDLAVDQQAVLRVFRFNAHDQIDGEFAAPRVCRIVAGLVGTPEISIKKLEPRGRCLRATRIRSHAGVDMSRRNDGRF
jgi:hypothetical protein